MIEPTVHASAVAIDGRGVLVRGPSGSGKSSLVVQMLIANPADAVLVADDRVVLALQGCRVLASPPRVLAGLIEIRGQGIRRVPHVVGAVPIELVVDLLPMADCPRLPTGEERNAMLEGVSVPRIFIARGATDGPSRVRAALDWPIYENA